MSQQPFSNQDKNFLELVQTLPSNWIDLMKKFGAFTRARAIKSPHQLIRVILLYCGLGATLREVAGFVSLMGGKITDQSIHTRIKKSYQFLKSCVNEMVQLDQSFDESSDFLASRKVRILDATKIVSTLSKKTIYALHLSLGLCGARVSEVLIESEKKGESLSNFDLQEGIVYIADRAYSRFKSTPDTSDR